VKQLVEMLRCQRLHAQEDKEEAQATKRARDRGHVEGKYLSGVGDMLNVCGLHAVPYGIC
jgi:hypothetical protein